MAKYITKPFEYIENTIGVEINFNKVFYKPEQLRPLSKITSDLKDLEIELSNLEKELANLGKEEDKDIEAYNSGDTTRYSPMEYKKKKQDINKQKENINQLTV